MQGVRQERDVFRAAFARQSLQTDCYAICNTVCAGISRKVVSRVGLEPTTRWLRGTTFFSQLRSRFWFPLFSRIWGICFSLKANRNFAGSKFRALRRALFEMSPLCIARGRTIVSPREPTTAISSPLFCSRPATAPGFSPPSRRHRLTSARRTSKNKSGNRRLWRARPSPAEGL
jgi:hypothetical protein